MKKRLFTSLSKATLDKTISFTQYRLLSELYTIAQKRQCMVLWIKLHELQTMSSKGIASRAMNGLVRAGYVHSEKTNRGLEITLLKVEQVNRPRYSSGAYINPADKYIHEA